MKKLVYGVGVNDADYVVQIKEVVGYKENGKKIQRQVWVCPFYRRWSDMLCRSYNEKKHLYRPKYAECFVSEEWLTFTNFSQWMKYQDWENKHLDKDLLFPGNKEYCAEKCVFVSPVVNSFILECSSAQGLWPVGVSFHKGQQKFVAQGSDFKTKKRVHIGTFDSPEKAHKAWLSFKLEQAYKLASEQTDPRVAAALISRYENYKS